MALRGLVGGLEEDEAELFAVRAEVLERAGALDAARRIRAQGRAWLQSTAQRIVDRTWRRRFIEDVAVHRALQER